MQPFTTWVRALAPSWLQQLAGAALTPTVIGISAGLSLVIFLGSVIGVPWFLTRLPADFLQQGQTRQSGVSRHTLTYILGRMAKNALGGLLILVGLGLLLLPGQGLLTLLAGLLLTDFPGKRRFERWLLSSGPVLRGVNRLRERSGKSPLLPP